MGPNEFYFTQPGLAQKFIHSGGMANANVINTPAMGEAVGADLAVDYTKFT